MAYYNKFDIFADTDFDAYARGWLEALKQTLHKESADYILNVNAADYLEHLTSQFSIDSLIMHFDKIDASTSEQMIPAEKFPPLFNVYVGKSYPKPVIKYHLPVTGNLDLLRCIPNPRVRTTYEVSLEGDAVCFEIIDFSNNAEQIKRQAQSILGTIEKQASSLQINVEEFNNSVRREAESLFNARKEELLRRANTLAALGVPIRKATNVPQTFAVPAQRKQVAPKPPAIAGPAKVPDPTLDEPIYQEILQVIHETGKVFERLPSTYADKDEESLRDHLILQLEPRFEYSATGETFNKKGKTDILIRHEKSNIFEAECKFWRGQKGHFETIDQVLSYLTWRDSKTAIVYFMDGKEMSVPLKVIGESTLKHSCSFNFNGRKHDSWFDYTFHLPADPGVPIRLSILCFHFPK